MVGIGVAPLRGGWDTADLTDKLFGQYDLRVGVAFDLVVAAGTGPGRVPGYAGAGDAINVGALGAGARVLAPEVVVDGILAVAVAAILVTEGLSEGRGEEGSKDCKGLHVVLAVNALLDRQTIYSKQVGLLEDLFIELLLSTTIVIEPFGNMI
ncbi:hypothetical protein CNMCM5793_000753 [Aspergillus hiratsukae]|uniref:Uncharacterized protein n=1 Tax=Aspergillus hiratsukae TaxID=1194566 RepID=A0A8H6UVV7_9EURO|nr:hypothetical protein CNMCM5793_000753 [Aspergillus hiratsukae]KAF7166124.1 hypothetical protein CNMCM6106_002082 [Aspergillus hiratsukae]